MTLCFYRYAQKLDAHAAELEQSDRAAASVRDTPARLRQVAADIRADCRPCGAHPRCECDRIRERTPAPEYTARY